MSDKKSTAEKAAEAGAKSPSDHRKDERTLKIKGFEATISMRQVKHDYRIVQAIAGAEENGAKSNDDLLRIILGPDQYAAVLEHFTDPEDGYPDGEKVQEFLADLFQQVGELGKSEA